MTFKDAHTLEGYIKYMNVSKFIYALARLRIGATDLNINKGYTQTEPNVNCPFCGSEENELHFIRDCPVYGHLRTKYLDPHYDYDSTATLKSYFCPVDLEALKALAQYTHHALRVRKDEITYNDNRARYTTSHRQADKHTQTDTPEERE